MDAFVYLKYNALNIFQSEKCLTLEVVDKQESERTCQYYYIMLNFYVY